jgi:hypothetical protein
MKAIQNPNCQDMMDPSEFLFRQVFNDGTNMLNTIHQRGWMVKVPTKSVVMTPSPGVDINLVDLNQQLTQISRERAAAGTTRSSDMLSNTAPATPASPPGVITDESLASKYRAQARTFETEARRLMEEAEKLDPKGAVAVAPAKTEALQASQPSTEVKKSRGRPPKVQAVA